METTAYVKKSACRLKARSRWFAAGPSFQRALTNLTDGPFRLFAYLCLQADRRTGRCEATHRDLARVLGKSRRIIGQYIADLEQEGICAVRSGRNQHSRTSFEILDEYWPYERSTHVTTPASNEDAYVVAVRDKFLALGCTRGRFSRADAETARALKESGVPLELTLEALVFGACRKYDSWLNGGPPGPIGSLVYFKPVIEEIREQPFPSGYAEYLESKVSQLARRWQEFTSRSGCGDHSEACPSRSGELVAQKGNTQNA